MNWQSSMVEWKKLGEISKRNKGIPITAGQMSELASSDGNVRVFAAGSTIADINENQLPQNCAYKLPSIIIKSRGYVDFVFYEKPFTHKNEMWSYSFGNKEQGKYIYYYLTTKTEFFRKEAKANSVKLPQLCVADTDNYLIPMPSLSEQNRIVGILDTFTSSIENIKQQIAERRKQSEYYRDQLLDLEGKEGVKMVALEDMGHYFGGLTGKTKEDFIEGNAKFITYMNVFANPALDISTTGVVRIKEGEKQNKIQRGDILFTGSSETPEEAGMSCVVTEDLTEDYYLNSFCFGIRLSHPEQYNLKYLKHILRSYSVRKDIARAASGVTRFNISKARFSKIQILIPFLQEQSRIVSILDTFETSIANLETQLELREKQYEYYRNKLLTFE